MSKSAAADVLAEFIADRVRRLDLDDRELLGPDIDDAVSDALESERSDLRDAVSAGPAHRSVRIAYRRRAGLL